jgi:AraC-like DNA-binding protein/CheY-like chemotaxis protein
LQVRSGIGLNLVKRLIEYLGGTITVTSEVGKYVEFSVVIPPLDVEGHNVIRLDPERNELPMADMEYKPKKHAETTIYVVEDNKSLRNLLLTILSDYTAVELNSDVETLEAIKHNYPDLIILDMMNNGLALVDSLKSDPKINYIPIIGISGDTSVEEEIEAYNHGVDVYMVKPFYPRQILSGIENLLTRQTLLKDYFNSSFSSLKIKNGIVLHQEDEALIEKVTDYIKDNIEDENMSPESIEQYLGMSRASLYRKFKEILAKTPSEYIKIVRLESAAKLLKMTKLTVSEIIYRSGFSNKSYFYREFQKMYGYSPTDYRKQ